MKWLFACAAAVAIGSGSSRAQDGSALVNFDEVDVTHGRLVAAPYLAKRGVAVVDVTANTLVVIAAAADFYDRRALVPASGANVLTQIGSNKPVSFTLRLPEAASEVRFTRPALLAGPTGVTFPEWRASALDAQGRVLAQAGEPLGMGEAYYTNVPAKTFTLKGAQITAVRFDSKNYEFAGFSAIVIDDLGWRHDR